MQSGPLISVPLLSRRQALAAFLQEYVLLMFYLDSNQWSTTRDDLPQSSDRDSGRLSGDDRDLLADALVGLEVEGEARVVLLDDHTRRLLDSLSADALRGASVGCGQPQ